MPKTIRTRDVDALESHKKPKISEDLSVAFDAKFRMPVELKIFDANNVEYIYKQVNARGNKTVIIPKYVIMKAAELIETEERLKVIEEAKASGEKVSVRRQKKTVTKNTIKRSPWKKAEAKSTNRMHAA